MNHEKSLKMKKFLKEPLVHFLVLGFLIFAAYGWLSRDLQSEDEIFISRGQQEHLVNMFTRTWQRPPAKKWLTGKAWQ